MLTGRSIGIIYNSPYARNSDPNNEGKEVACTAVGWHHCDWQSAKNALANAFGGQPKSDNRAMGLVLLFSLYLFLLFVLNCNL